MRSLKPEVPETLEQIVQKAMAKAKEERYQTAEDLLADLKEAKAPEQTSTTIAATEARERKKRKNRVRMLIAAGTGILLLAVLFAVVLPLSEDQALASNPRAIAFISLENRTGDESLAYLRNVLPEVLGTTLEESKYVRVIRFDRIRELMKDVGKDSVEFIDKETGLLLCRRAKIDVLCVGNYTKAGPLFLTELELIDVNREQRLGGPFKARGSEVESFLRENGIVDDLARQISKGVGVSPMGTGSTVKPIAEVSSGSIQAQRYYQRGKQEITKFNTTDARRFLEMAVKEDSTFAIAWFWLGAACGYLGDSPAREFAMGHAVKNASRATEKERFWIAGVDSNLRASLLKSKGYKDTGRDNLSWLKARTEIFPLDSDFRRDYGIMLGSYLGRTAEAIPEYEKAIQLDPAVGRTWNELGYCYVFEGQYDKGMQALERSAELDPGEPNPLQSMADCLLIQGKFDEGITRCEAALQVKPDSYAGLTLAKLYFMKEDYFEAARWTARASELAPTPLLRDDCLWWRAWYLIWAGRLKEAEEVLHASEQKMMLEYQKKNITESDKFTILGGISWLKGWCAYDRGEWKKARLDFSNLPARGNWPSLSQLCLGLLDLQQGKMDSIEMRQRRIRDILLARVELEPARSELYLETDRCMRNALQGAYLLVADHPEKIQPNWTRRRSNRIRNQDSLAAANMPLFVQRISEVWDMQWIPTPFDILPRAYIRLGLIDSAIASYELSLKKPPHALGPIIPRYYYRVARLYEQKGMKEKAIENYAQFLKVWGKADPVYKEPADARARLAKLKRTI
ncbi:MAG: serine/threonine protein kinase with repeat [Deltaproteobacteria bacterium]|nr:serine/threonine protein kinase with repeat [Deltaproteobacteria bacterium]